MAKNIRIHNDIGLTWSISYDTGEAYNLEGKDLRLEMRVGCNRIEIQDFTVSGNTIRWVFYGKDQCFTGRYDVVLCENFDGRGMMTVDTQHAFNLVRHSWETGGNDGKVVTETVELASEVGTMIDERLIPDSIARDAEVRQMLGDYLPLAGGTMTGEVNMGGSKITDLADPESDADAATRGFVESAIADSAEVFWAIENQTTAAEIYAAYQAGKVILAVRDAVVFALVYSTSTGARFAAALHPGPGGPAYFNVTGSTWGNIVYMDYAYRSELSVYARKSGDVFTGRVDLSGGATVNGLSAANTKITDVASPTNNNDAANKVYVDSLIAALQQFHYEIYPSIASVASPASNVLYLIGPTGTGSDKYEEYVYANNTFVKIGDTSIDLSGYMPKSGGTFTGDVLFYEDVVLDDGATSNSTIILTSGSDLVVEEGGDVLINGNSVTSELGKKQNVIVVDFPDDPHVTDALGAGAALCIDTGLHLHYVSGDVNILHVEERNVIQSYTIKDVSPANGENCVLEVSILVGDGGYVHAHLTTTGEGNFLWDDDTYRPTVLVPGYSSSVCILLPMDEYTPKFIVEGSPVSIQIADFAQDFGLIYPFKNISVYSIEQELYNRQPTLVSGTNIKTVNNQSLLGSGNIEIQGGGGSADAVTYTEQTLTDTQKEQARENIDAQETIDTVNVTVSNTTGTPSGSASVSGGTLNITLNNIKGETGATGPQGNTGSSVDYPYELVNNLTTDDATKGLSAAQGVVLEGEISQLGQEVNGLEITASVAPSAYTNIILSDYGIAGGDMINVANQGSSTLGIEIRDAANTTTIERKTVSPGTNSNITLPSNAGRLRLYSSASLTAIIKTDSGLKKDVSVLQATVSENTQDIDSLNLTVYGIVVEEEVVPSSYTKVALSALQSSAGDDLIFYNGGTTNLGVNFRNEGDTETVSSVVVPGGEKRVATIPSGAALIRMYCNRNVPVRIAADEGIKWQIDSFVPADEIVVKSFNASFHNGAEDWKIKAKEYSMLFNNSGENEAFLFFTDPHFFTRDDAVWKERMPEFIAEIQKYYNSTSSSFCISGGDWLTAQDSNDVAKFRLGYADGIMNAMFKEFFPVFGNHDDNYQGASVDGGTAATATPLDRQTIVNLWFRKFKSAYYDFVGSSSRIYVFDTGNDWKTGMDEYRWEQIDWFGKSLEEKEDAHIIVVAHIAYNSSADISSNTLFPMTDYIAQLAQAYNSKTTITLNGVSYDFQGARGKVEFILAGHCHADVSAVKYGIPIICTINTMAITTSPSFDLMYVDYDARLVHCIRVGSGSNRQISLSA